MNGNKVYYCYFQSLTMILSMWTNFIFVYFEKNYKKNNFVKNKNFEKDKRFKNRHLIYYKKKGVYPKIIMQVKAIFLLHYSF